MKRIFILLLLSSFINNCMEQFSADDRKQVRMQVAKYILSKQNNTIPVDEVVASSPTLQRLNGKVVIKDFNSNIACIDDYEAKLRYRVYLDTKKVEETQLTKN